VLLQAISNPNLDLSKVLFPSLEVTCYRFSLNSEKGESRDSGGITSRTRGEKLRIWGHIYHDMEK